MGNDALAQLEGTLRGAASRLGGLFNLGAGPTAVLGFLAEGVFKGVRLGLEIRRRQAELNAALDQRIRARSLVRTPIAINLAETEFRNFYDNKANVAAFAVLAELAEEIAEYDRTGGLVSKATRARLELARVLAPALTSDPELVRSDHAGLRDMFLIGLDPTRRTLRGLIEEFLRLYPDSELTVGAYFDLAADFWKDKLALEIQAISRAQIEAQAELDQSVRSLVRGAFLGDEGGAAKILGLVKELKKQSIDARIKGLQDKLGNAPADQRAALQKQIEDLTKWKARLA
ncbi:MAG TPA: hypothetical protein VNJ11_16835 [Bryobacteraceae bacterium]|nr:hypothetical protein [Bryobacteraceae bacterium]